MIGTTLSHYKILDELGRGGMGIVYKAEDTKLDRTVAIKVLPSAALASADDRARFYREAKAAAALTHPHIAIIHAVDEAVVEGAPHGTEPSPFIAMEFIDGETLDARVQRGPLKLEEAVRIASEIASALSLAHENEIVHRDIKSANVMLTKSGAAKVLDFGLAQTTASTKLTQMGSTLGTVAYMSPEQTRGEPVDRRSDIWSLGAVMYEMIAGRAPFGGDYEQALVYGILNEDPEPLTAIRTGVGMDLEWIVSKCLAKKVDERYQSATDLMVDLKRVSAAMEKRPAGLSQSAAMTGHPVGTGITGTTRASISGATVATVVSPPGETSDAAAGSGILTNGHLSLSKPLAAALGGVLLLLGGLFAWIVLFPGSTNSSIPQTRKLELLLPGIQRAAFPVLSPNKEWISFMGTDTLRRSGLYMMEIATGAIHYTEDTELADEHAAFSPDGSKIAFTQYGERKGVYVSVIPGGVPQLIADYGRVPVWLDEHSIVIFDNTGDARPHIIDLDTGETTIVSLEGNAILDGNHFYWTSRLPDSRIILADIEPDQHGGEAGTLAFIDTEADRLIVSEAGIINPYFTPDGMLVYQRGTDNGALLARPLDVTSYRFTGQPEVLLPKMSWPAFSVGADGSLVYVPSGISGDQGHMKLYVIDTDDGSFQGYEFELPRGSGVEVPNFSPVDPNLILVRVTNLANSSSNLSVYDLEHQTLSQRTFSGRPSWGAWSADGKSVYAEDEETAQLLKIDLESAGGSEVVLENAHSPALSPDGKWLAAAVGDDNNWDLYLMNLEKSELVPVDTTDGYKFWPSFSPDSRHIVYVSTGISGMEGRMFIADVNGPGRFAVGTRMASAPQWSADGRYLYFSDTTDSIYRIRLSTNAGISVIGQAELVGRVGLGRSFSVSGNSPRLAVISTDYRPAGFEQDLQNVSLIWWENWTQDFR